MAKHIWLQHTANRRAECNVQLASLPSVFMEDPDPIHRPRCTCTFDAFRARQMTRAHLRALQIGGISGQTAAAGRHLRVGSTQQRAHLPHPRHHCTHVLRLSPPFFNVTVMLSWVVLGSKSNFPKTLAGFHRARSPRTAPVQLCQPCTSHPTPDPCM
jgi:hypothetical protein